jgi:hypothetical protein
MSTKSSVTLLVTILDSSLPKAVSSLRCRHRHVRFVASRMRLVNRVTRMARVVRNEELVNNYPQTVTNHRR